MTTNNSASGTDTELPSGHIPEHQRRNYEESDLALIRMEGLICALDLVANDMSPEARRSDKEWSALLSLTDMLGRQAEDIWRLRLMEWVGLGGRTDKLAEADCMTYKTKTPIGLTSIRVCAINHYRSFGLIGHAVSLVHKLHCRHSGR